MFPIQFPTILIMRALVSTILTAYSINLASSRVKQGYGVFAGLGILLTLREASGLGINPAFFLFSEGLFVVAILIFLGRMAPGLKPPLLISIPIYVIVTVIFGFAGPIHQTILSPLFQVSLLVLLHNHFQLEVVADKLRIAQLSENISLVNSTLKSMGEFLETREGSEKLYTTILSGALKSSQADSGVLFLVDDGQRGTIRVAEVWGKFPQLPEISPTSTPSPATYYSQDEIYPTEGACLQEVLSTGNTSWNLLTHNPEGCRILILSPLIVDHRVYGIIALAMFHSNSLPHKIFREQYEQYIIHAGITLESVLSLWKSQEQQLLATEGELLGQVQKHLLPKGLPSIKGLEYGLISRPATGIHSDYWDVFPGQEGTVAFLVCDIAGKGILSTLAMTIIRGTANLIGGSERSAGEVLSWLNRAITRRLKLDRFANILYFTYKPGRGSINYSGASHQNLLIYRLETGNIERIQTHQPPLGIDPTTKYQSQDIPVDSGDILLAYTDGVVESINPEGVQYSSKNLASLLVSNHHYTAQAIIDRLREDLLRFEAGADNHDDQTLLLIKFK